MCGIVWRNPALRSDTRWDLGQRSACFANVCHIGGIMQQTVNITLLFTHIVCHIRIVPMSQRPGLYAIQV
jgi:hypothetical protein